MLDINTPKGQITLEQEQRAGLIIEKSYNEKYQYVQTPKKTKADVDSFLVSEKLIMAHAETKCRDNTLRTLRNLFNNRWLITNEKIEKGRRLSDILQVPYIGFLYLVPDDVLLTLPLYDPETESWLIKYYTERTRTQKTCNGGSIVRENAYIDMSNAKIFSGEKILGYPSPWYTGKDKWS